eukprot:12309187-Ditylum_brightwellii.AAC.1
MVDVGAQQRSGKAIVVAEQGLDLFTEAVDRPVPVMREESPRAGESSQSVIPADKGVLELQL